MTKFHLEDDTGHLWAVSYADFLMVLLSFFILFFSVNKKDKDTIISIISQVKQKGLGSGQEGTKGVGSASRTTAGVGNPAQPKAIVEELKGKLTAIKWEVNDKEKSVTFLLDDEIFGRGQVELGSEGREKLKMLLELLKPYVADVDLVFVGHTDSRPVKSDHIAGVSNNFDLSALRAAHAVKLAMGMGLPKDSLFTHGSADNTRSTKSLSVVVVQKGAGRI